jgi:hypothetical protein
LGIEQETKDPTKIDCRCAKKEIDEAKFLHLIILLEWEAMTGTFASNYRLRHQNKGIN